MRVTTTFSYESSLGKSSKIIIVHIDMTLKSKSIAHLFLYSTSGKNLAIHKMHKFSILSSLVLQIGCSAF